MTRGVTNDPLKDLTIRRMGGLATAAKHRGPALTAPARKAYFQRFLDAVDQPGLTDEQRMQRAKDLQKVWMLKLSLLARDARAARKAAAAAKAAAGTKEETQE